MTKRIRNNRGQSTLQDVEELRQLELVDLRIRARKIYGLVPQTRSKDLLSLMIGYSLQAKETQGLDEISKRALNRERNVSSQQNSVAVKKLSSGVTITKQWQGQRIEVKTLEQGRFEFRGQIYTSLTQIATLITSTKWNGPRFFGLRENTILDKIK